MGGCGGCVARADVLRGWFVGVAVEMAEPPARAPPDTSPLGLVLRAVADAFLAARLRLGPGAVSGGVWAFSSAATSGRAVGQHERALGSASGDGQAAALTCLAVKEDVMDWRQEEALWRYSLIREAADARLSCGERGALVRLLAARLHAHPSGELRSVGRSTLDDWIRAYRARRVCGACAEAARVGAAHGTGAA